MKSTTSRPGLAGHPGNAAFAASLLGAALLGSAAFATSAAAQEVYLRAAEPLPPGTVIIEEPGEGPGYLPPGYLAPGGHVIVREAPPRVVVREAPARVIVTDPVGGPYAREVYVRRPAPPEALPEPYYGEAPYGGDCRTVERQSRAGLVTVSTVCD